MSAVLARRVAAALEAMDPDAREALELRERDGLAYAAIGERVDRSVDGVAVLLVAARMELRESVLGTAPVPISGEYCTQARAWLGALEDREELELDEVQWTRAHMHECDTCTDARRALREAALAARAWVAAGAPTVAELGDDDEPDASDEDDAAGEGPDGGGGPGGPPATDPGDQPDDVAEESGTAAEGPDDRADEDGARAEMVAHRPASPAVFLRRRMGMAAGVTGAVIVLALLTLGGGGPSDQRRVAAPSDGGVVPPPSQTFCAAGETGC